MSKKDKLFDSDDDDDVAYNPDDDLGFDSPVKSNPPKPQETSQPIPVPVPAPVPV